jgi:hypothetical protein
VQQPSPTKVPTPNSPPKPTKPKDDDEDELKLPEGPYQEFRLLVCFSLTNLNPQLNISVQRRST